MYSKALNISPQPTVAGYCSLAQNFQGAHLSDQGLLNEFCLSLSGESEIFAEEISPRSATRPMWKALLRDLNGRLFNEVVFPSLSHIAGNDVNKTRAFLEFASELGIRVRCLREQFNTDEDSIDAMIAHLSILH